MTNKFTLILFLVLAWSSFAFSQTIITGKVTDAGNGEPLIGANVIGKGTSRVTITELDGSYSLQIDEGTTTLVFSYTGYSTKEIAVDGQTTIDVALVEGVLVDELVVVGYGTQKRSSISGSVSVLTSDEITEQPNLRLEQALQGRAAGVQVTQNSGSPGSSLTVRIRGIGTINNSDPLYIVDGIPVSGLDFLNTNDIESINVLKDAASSAIYGARGANGVVLITTKTGKKGKTGNVTVESYYGVQSPWKKINLMSAEEYAIISNEAHMNSGQVPLAELANPAALGAGTDWQDAIFQTAPIQSHQLSFMGGSQSSTYSLSGNYFQQDGIVGGDKSGFERYTVRFNGTNEVKDWLRLGNSVNYVHLTRNGLPENNEFTTPLVRALNMDPITPVYKADGTYAYSRYADTDITNPVNAIQNTYDTWTSDRIVGAAWLEADITPHLKFRSSYSLDATFASQNVFYPIFDLSNDPVLSDAPAGEKSVVNTVVEGRNRWFNQQWENLLTYTNLFQEKHNVTVIGGTTFLQNRHDYSGGANTNLPTNDPKDAYLSNTIDPIESQSTYAGASESALLSFFTRVNYEYDDKYLASATFRVDGSSRFGANKRFGYFPSFSAGWILSREDFFTIEPISLLKVRASWGQNGNDRIGDYGFTSVVSTGQNYTFGVNENITNGSIALVPGNPDLQWETSTQTNIGIDAEFWNGKLNFTTDFYTKKTSDMLYAAPIPLTVGAAGFPIQNIGSMKNSGLELSLTYADNKGGLTYNLGGNIGFVNTEVLSLGDGGDPLFTGRVQSANATVSKTEVGQPIAYFYGYVTDGLFQTSEEVAAHALQDEDTQPGDIRFKDLDGNGVIDENDRTMIGNPTPKFTYGMSADFKYKGFDLSLFIAGSYGNDIYNATVRYDFTYVNRPVSVLNRWTGPGTSNFEPRASLTDPNQNARVSDRFIEDGSFIRLKNLQLGYTLPESALSRMNFQKVRFYLSAQNLFTFTKYSGLDPEIGAYNGLEIGIDRGFYPQARTILGGVSLVF